MKNNEELIKYMLNFGFTPKNISKILHNCIINNLTTKRLLLNIKRNNKYLLEKGYNNQEIIKISTSAPSIYVYSIKKIEEKISNLINVGYTEKEVLKNVRIIKSRINRARN